MRRWKRLRIMPEIILSADIEKKLRRIETQIISIVNYEDFFKVLLKEIKAQFSIPYTWITLIAENEISAFIQTAGSGEDLENCLTVIEREIFLKLIGTTSKPLVIKDDLKRYYSLFPPDSSYFIKSIAIAPISLDGAVIGSLNLADFSGTRFHQRTYIQLLELLAIKISISLSNVTAHEKSNSLTFHDPTTGLLNRNVMQTILEREFRRNQRYQNDLSLVLIELDDIDRASGLSGVEQRDYLFKYVADQAVQAVRDSDVITRYGDGKLAVIMPQTKADNALNLVSRIQRTYQEQPLRIKGRAVALSMNFGVASTETGNITNAHALLKHADENLARSKNVSQEKLFNDNGKKNRSKVIPLHVSQKEQE